MKLAVSVGCPCGIGPEVAVAAAQAWRDRPESLLLVGDPGALADAAARRAVDLALLLNVSVVAASELPPSDRVPGQPGVAAGKAQLAAIDRALALVTSGAASAMVTGPVSKAVISASGTPFTGHTEYLQHKTASRRVVMMFAGPRLRTSLVTNHLALANVSRALSREGIADTIGITASALVREFGVAQPRIVVCALNPHAGESGLLGTEERDVIEPAVRDATARVGAGGLLAGPIGAETAFREARDGKWDAVVAMYHDQATIASKLLDFGDAVNVTLGLPIVRTSVDHGTAYDLAGKGRADERGMIAALQLAAEMAGRRGM